MIKIRTYSFILILLHCIAANASQLSTSSESQETIKNIDATNKRGETALMRATGSGNVEMTQLLLQYKANPNAQDSLGRTPLMWATIGNYPDTAKLLIQSNAKINVQDKDKKTALIYATAHDDGTCLQLLLNNNADSTIQDNCGKIALMHAVEWNIKKNIDTLCNVKPFLALDNYGNTIDDYLKEFEQRQIRAAAHEKRMKEYAEQESKTNHETLSLTLFNDDTHGLTNYIKNGGELRACKLGFIPLHQAAIKNHVQAIDILLGKKVDINEQDEYGQTALMLACYYGKKYAVLNLLRRGANPSIKSKFGHNAFQMAYDRMLHYRGNPKWELYSEIASTLADNKYNKQKNRSKSK